MNHLILIVISILCVEILINSNYTNLIFSIYKVSNKARKIILNKNISDNWKENTIPKYSIQIMKSSCQLLLILLLIIFIFLIADYFFVGLLAYTFSWNGIIETVLFVFIYFYFKKFIKR